MSDVFAKVITQIVMKKAFNSLAGHRTVLKALCHSRQKTSSVFVSRGMEKGKYLKGYRGMFGPRKHYQRIYEGPSNLQKCFLWKMFV